MSYDYDVTQAACDHAQTLERYIVNSLDFRTLNLAANTAINMRAPINGQAAVQVYIGGSLVSPSDVNYGYSMVLDSSRIDVPGVLFYKIVFNKQVRLIRSLIEVSYFTRQSFCLKCAGLGVLNDLKKSVSGELTHIFKTNKLVQKSLKFVLTSTCPFYPQYTCPIKTYLGKKFGIQITDADVANAVMTALNQIKTIQSAQRTVQTLDPLEMLNNITNVAATVDSSDPTQINVSAQVTSFGNISSPMNFTMSTTKSAQFYSPGGNQ